ncbi:MAG TPA: energy transducer TonB [Pyrinomonadaceae bacterium]|nr:energy transducer TonB [Pyrinomonadaceae bacterium]
MKGIRPGILLHPSFKLINALALSLSLAGVAYSQEVVQASENVAGASARAAQPAPEADATQRRIARARALAASGKRGVAAGELEALYNSTKDEYVRDVSRILLMWIYVELPDYTRAAQLLEQTYNNRAAAGEEGARDYYALAGQVLSGARTHAERYRTFGLRPDDAELPAEAKADLDLMRSLVERVLEQAKAAREETARDRGGEATALVEEAANVRLRLARDDAERARWQGEVADARQRLFTPDARIAKVSDSRNVAAGVQTQSAPATTAAPPAVANAQPAASAPQGASVNNSTANVSSAAAGGEAKKVEAGPKTEGGTVAVGALHNIARQRVSPSYPQIARTARISGLVTVYVVVNEKGEVERVQRADGPIQLQSAASEAARRWKFHPTVVDGQPVKVSGYINFNFAL